MIRALNAGKRHELWQAANRRRNGLTPLWVFTVVLCGCGAHPADLQNDADVAPLCVHDDDDDGDGISNMIEGCFQARDTDGDGLFDWQDPDSDNDGCLDSEEDPNGDGEVGSCRRSCEGNSECGEGQHCVSGDDGHTCSPPVAPQCAGGEHDPRNPDTYDDGLHDCLPMTTICEDVGPDSSGLRPTVQYHTAPGGRLQLAVWDHVAILDQLITNAGAEDCANAVDDDGDGLTDCEDTECHNTSSCLGTSVTFDLLDPGYPGYFSATAGFALTRSPSGVGVDAERDQILAELGQLFGADSVTLRSKGMELTLLEQVETRALVTVEVEVAILTSVREFRDRLVTHLLHRSPGEITNFPPHVGNNTTGFVISFAVQRRTPTLGDPYVAVMGAVTSRFYYDDPLYDAVREITQIANGTGLATPDHGHTTECSQLEFVPPPYSVDILWIVDDSAWSASERRLLGEGIFDAATRYGLDFRMGVTNMNPDSGGALCTDYGHSDDFFLSHRTSFLECLEEPGGSFSPAGDADYGLIQSNNAIVSHLPRENALDRIRPDAKLVVIYLSDEAPEEIQQACGSVPPWDATCIQAVLQPTLNLLQGVTDPEAQGTAHAIVGSPYSGCSETAVSGGYVEIANATGGTAAPVCSDSFALAQALIVSALTGESSGVLSHRPISATLAVAQAGVVLEPDLETGFWYSLMINAVTIPPLVPPMGGATKMVISYERWVAP